MDGSTAYCCFEAMGRCLGSRMAFCSAFRTASGLGCRWVCPMSVAWGRNSAASTVYD